MQQRNAARMITASSPRPVILIAAPQERSPAGLIEDHGYAVVQVHTATLALAWAADLRPDAIVLDAELPDTSGIALCQALHLDLRIGHNVPILILAPKQPTPEQRVAALRAGAWDFLAYGRDSDDLALTLQTYVQAKRNIDLALAQGLADPTTGVHSRSSLARRARELGALSPTEVAVLAPGTDSAGAVKLAHRIGAAMNGGAASPRAAQLRAGYAAVDNLTYTPIDPVELLTRAATAVRTGAPDPHSPWVRRFEAKQALDREGNGTSRLTTAGPVSDKGRTRP